MIANVKAYYNTGLQVNNCLDDISKLDSLGFTSRTFDSIAIKQDRGRIDIRINTTYDNIKDADYIKINDIGYWVTGINMLNDNVAQVSLQQDFITTLGISNIEVTSGWCTRRCVTDDTIYSNVIEEEFIPSNELIVEGCTQILNGSTGGQATGHINIVLSNIDLLNLQLIAKAYLDTDNDKVLVPQLPTISQDSQTQYTSHPLESLTAYSNTISMTAAYDPNDSNVMAGIQQLRSLGIESAIGASYQLPNNWARPTGSGLYSRIEDINAAPASRLPAITGTYRNNKVYSGQFQKIVIYSICSGEFNEFRPEDIVNNLGQINWYLWADTRYNGYPACKPYVYRGKINESNFGLIKGAGWQQTPFMYTVGQSGYAVTIGDAAKIYAQQIGQTASNALGLAGSLAATGVTLGSAYGAADSSMFMANSAADVFAAQGRMDAIGLQGGNQMMGLGTRASSLVNQAFANKRSFLSTMRQALRPSPELQFPQAPQLQDYVGNNFYEMRYRLSDNDMARFDNYLTQFGYAVDEALAPSCFTGRTHFNYVKGEDVVLKKSGAPQYLLAGAAAVIESGVRIWHTAPAATKLFDNPITI